MVGEKKISKELEGALRENFLESIVMIVLSFPPIIMLVKGPTPIKIISILYFLGAYHIYRKFIVFWAEYFRKDIIEAQGSIAAITDSKGLFNQKQKIIGMLEDGITKIYFCATEPIFNKDDIVNFKYIKTGRYIVGYEIIGTDYDMKKKRENIV